MRKRIALLLACLMVIGFLAGCGKEDGGGETDTDPQTPVTETGEEKPETDPEDTSDEKEDADEPESGDAAESDLQRGVWTDGVYTNAFAGLRFALPEGWNVASDEEMAAMMGASLDMLYGESGQVTSDWLKLQTAFDMIATDPLTGNNVIIMFENMKMVVGGTSLTPEAYLDLVMEQLETQLGEKIGVEETADAYTTETLSGETYTTCEISAQGMAQHYYLRTVGSHMVQVIITITNGEDVSTFLEQFGA